MVKAKGKVKPTKRAAADIDINVECWWAAHGGDMGTLFYALDNGADVGLVNEECVKETLPPLLLYCCRRAAAAARPCCFCTHRTRRCFCCFCTHCTRHDTPPSTTTLRTANQLAPASLRYGTSPVHVASTNGHLPVVQLLAFKGVDLAAKDRRDRTAFWLACAAGHPEVVKFLLDKCDCSAPDRSGVSAFDIAVHRGHEHVVRLLELPLSHSKMTLTPLELRNRNGLSGTLAAAQALDPRLPARETKAAAAGRWKTVKGASALASAFGRSGAVEGVED